MVLLMLVTVIVDFLPERWTDKMVRKFAGKDLRPYEKDGDGIVTCRRCNQYTLMSMSNPHLCVWCESYELYQDTKDEELQRKRVQERQRREEEFSEWLKENDF
jgi:diaminopimelate epimerase